LNLAVRKKEVFDFFAKKNQKHPLFSANRRTTLWVD
jgi:hypothetical protein